jgi:hypothetical protein
VTDSRVYIERQGAPYRLGRHQVHGALPMELEALEDRLTPIKTVSHREAQPVWDQGRIGSCTAHAALGCLVTEPFAKPGVTYTEAACVELYRLETTLDDSLIPGHYPPVDTGSTGPWSMQALIKQGRISSFRHTRGMRTALRMLHRGPVSLGVPWYESQFQVDSDDTIHVDQSSGLAGGHQICVVGLDAERQLIRIRNSWGPGWGDQGHAWLSWADLELLLHLGGDVVQPIL